VTSRAVHCATTTDSAQTTTLHPWRLFGNRDGFLVIRGNPDVAGTIVVPLRRRRRPRPIAHERPLAVNRMLGASGVWVRNDRPNQAQKPPQSVVSCKEGHESKAGLVRTLPVLPHPLRIAGGESRLWGIGAMSRRGTKILLRGAGSPGMSELRLVIPWDGGDVVADPRESLVPHFIPGLPPYRGERNRPVVPENPNEADQLPQTSSSSPQEKFPQTPPSGRVIRRRLPRRPDPESEASPCVGSPGFSP
jgi:hypothetical protein